MKGPKSNTKCYEIECHEPCVAAIQLKTYSKTRGERMDFTVQVCKDHYTMVTGKEYRVG